MFALIRERDYDLREVLGELVVLFIFHHYKITVTIKVFVELYIVIEVEDTFVIDINFGLG